MSSLSLLFPLSILSLFPWCFKKEKEGGKRVGEREREREREREMGVIFFFTSSLFPVVLLYRIGTNFRGVKISRFCQNIFIIKFSKVLFNFHGFVMAPCPFRIIVVWWYLWISDGEGEQRTEFLFSGQWLDVSNRAPFLSLSCPAIVCDFVWAWPHKNFARILFMVWLVLSKTAKLNHPQKFVPIR